MPGPFIHIAVSDHLRKQLKDQTSWSDLAALAGVPALSGPAPAKIADWAERHPSYYALGAVGPDLFFFLPDFRAYCVKGRGGVPGRRVPIANSLIGVVEWLEEFYAKLDAWILEDWERYFGPGSENSEEAISRFTGDMSTLVSDITGRFAAVGTTALLSLASQAYDWFGLFSLGLNKGYDNQDFFWSDMLHYRKTSQFGRSLWEIANAREATGLPTPAKATEIADQLRAYALGYITHLATDTAGHPFVNEKSGGPFRTHWQRHHLVENHMDAQTYDDEHGGDPIYNELTESGLHYRIAFRDDDDDLRRPLPSYTAGADSLRALYVRRRHLDLDSQMPSELADLLFEAMGKTFNTANAPTLAGAADSSPRIIMGGDGRPDVATIQLAYDICFRYLKLSMLDGFKHEKPKPPSVFPNLDFPLLTDPHDDPPNEGDPDMSFWDWVLAIVRFIRWLAAVAIWIATILPAMALDVATYLPRLIAYYAIELPLYYMVKAERRIMVMSGFMHPMKDEIDNGLVRLCLGHDDFFLSMLKSMNDSLGGIEDNGLAAIGTQGAKLAGILGIAEADAVAQLLGVADAGSTRPTEPPPNANYPHSQPLDGKNPIEYHAPWQYPTSPTELSPTFAGPYECGDMPHILLDGGMTGDQAIRAKYEQAKTPAETDQISFTTANKVVNLGDPINFAAYLTWQLTRKKLPKTNESSVTDWNLDADRGYAYKCWDWNRHFEPKQGASREHVLRDMEGNQYMEPCTAPPQSEDPNTKGGCVPPPTTKYDPDKPLEIHYTTEPDEGC